MENHSQAHKPIYGKGQSVAFTGTAGSTGNLATGCTAVWVLCTAAAYVKVGASATATASDMPVEANKSIILAVDGVPESQRVSAVQLSTGGNMHIIPLVY
jgi:hypothetical protein